MKKTNQSPSNGSITWTGYKYSMRSKLLSVGFTMVWILILRLLAEGIFGDTNTIGPLLVWALLSGVGIFVIMLPLTLTHSPEIRRQKAARKKKGLPIHPFSIGSMVIFYVLSGIYFTVYFATDWDITTYHLFNKIFQNPDSVPPGQLQWWASMILTVFLPILIIYWISFGMRMLIEKKMRRSRRLDDS